MRRYGSTMWATSRGDRLQNVRAAPRPTAGTAWGARPTRPRDTDVYQLPVALKSDSRDAGVRAGVGAPDHVTGTTRTVRTPLMAAVGSSLTASTRAGAPS